jgi:hypothetical protein
MLTVLLAAVSAAAMLSSTSASNGPLSFGYLDTKMKSLVAPTEAGCVWRIAGNEVGIFTASLRPPAVRTP